MFLKKSRTASCMALLACVTLAMVLCSSVIAGEEGKAEAPKPKTQAASPPPMPNFTPPPMPVLPYTNLPDVVARVEDVEILGKDFQAAMQMSAQMMAAQAARNPNRDPNSPPPPFTKEDAQKMLDNMVTSKVVLLLAEKDGTVISDEDVDAALLEATQGRLTLEQIEEAVKKQGRTMDEIRVDFRGRVLTEKYVEKLTADIKSTDEEIAAEYAKLKDAGRLEKPGTADVAHILVKVTKDADEAAQAEAKKKIDDARARVVAGEDFGKVAGEVSEDPGSKMKGGLYEGVPKGQMVPEFDKLTFELPVGELSEPFKTQFGWHFLRVASRSDAETVPLEEVSEKIAEVLTRPKKIERVEEVVEEAKKTLKIEMFLTESNEVKDNSKAEVTLPLDPS
jgi:foldase protein PrsA